jgi:NADPH:quinone reductase-like Zn-dependent oxidoreductase
MKALHFKEYGAPSILRVADFPMPKPGPGEVLIQIKSAAINPSDVKNVAGFFKSPLPRIPGRDFAGIVVDGDAEKGLEVWGSGAGFGVTRDGAHAEFIVVPRDWLSVKPPQLSMDQAAAVGVPYLTAFSALVKTGNVSEKETVLIAGVSGAVGRAATQIAHWKRACVIGTSRNPENPSGADFLIDTTSKDLEKEVRAITSGRGVDLALDAVGGSMFEPTLKSLRHGGRQISITSAKDRRVSFDLPDFYHNESRLIGVDTMSLTGATIRDLMNELSAGFERGYLQPPEIKTWPFDQAVQAYEAVAQGKLSAKQVIVPNNG